jgi:hypothetical protein
MGKKTDKFTSDLTKFGDECEGILTKLVQAGDEMAANSDEWDKYRSNYNDPGFEKVRTDREEIWERGMQLCRDLHDAAHKLNLVLSEFRTYIQKKEKSKNPFKSKKSLPAAKDTIRVYDGFYQNVTKALSAIRSASFH